MSCKITFNIIGDKFSPDKIEFDFTTQNESTDISDYGRFKGLEYGYGSASYVVPNDISREEQFKYLADLFEPLIPKLKEFGADDWHISIGRLYVNQCNEEISKEEIIQIGRLKCSITYSAYKVDKEEDAHFDFEK